MIQRVLVLPINASTEQSIQNAITTADGTMGTSSTARIAVLMPTWIGDACMATPMLTSLRESFPGAVLVGVMPNLVHELLAEDADAPIFDERVIFHKQGKKRVSHSVSRLELIVTLRRMKLDYALLLPNSFWSAAVVWAAGIPNRVGYNRDGRGLLLSERIPVPKADGKPKPVSAIDYYLELMRPIGGQFADRTMKLHVGEEDRELATRLWQKIGFSNSRETVVLNSNAAKDVSRVWPREKVKQLALELVERADVQVLLHCGPSERKDANELVAELNHPCLQSMGAVEELPLGLSRGVMERASTVVSTDSGARHMAVALNRPVVTLYGSTSPLWTETYNTP
ncbi:MAG: glycosyltransferase family 9 protein [Planctomycetota bacterium]